MLIQSTIFPDSDSTGSEFELYFRKSDPADHDALQITDGTIHLQKGQILDTSTYFNSFSAIKWKRHTTIEEVILRINISGKYEIKVFDNTLNADYIVQNELCREVGDEEGFSCSLPFEKLQGIVSFQLKALDDVVFNGAEYLASEPPSRNITITGVMCTFKKESYVQKNLDVLNEKIFKNDKSPLSNNFQLLIIDNGKTLPKDEDEGWCRVLHNKNTGGAGGFTRGMIEAKKRFPQTTHILLMDDDIKMMPASIERLCSFLGFLKDEYLHAFIGGSMLRKDLPYIQHEASAYWSENGEILCPINPRMDLRSLSNVIKNEKVKPVKNQIAAWWFCCIPAEEDLLENLPLPLFIRGDDSEYALRRAHGIINLNSICVWHEPFEQKIQGYLTSYYKTRNYAILKAIHFESTSLAVFLKEICAKTMSYCVRLDYSGAELFLRGINDYLLGTTFFLQHNPDKDLAEIRSIDEIWKPLEKKIDKKFVNKLTIENNKEKVFRKTIRIATLNGLILPFCLYKKEGVASIYGEMSKIKYYFGKRKITVYNHMQGNHVVRYVSRKKMVKIISNMIRIFFVAISKYDRVTTEFSECYTRLTMDEFWIMYLEN